MCVETFNDSVIVNNNVVGLLFLVGGCDRVIHCHHTYLFFVLKVFLLSFGELNNEETYTTLPFGLMLLLFRTFSLQMIVFLFFRAEER